MNNKDIIPGKLSLILTNFRKPAQRKVLFPVHNNIYFEKSLGYLESQLMARMTQHNESNPGYHRRRSTE